MPVCDSRRDLSAPDFLGILAQGSYHNQRDEGEEEMRAFAVGVATRAASAASAAGARRGRVAQFGARQEWILPPRVASGLDAGRRNLATSAGGATASTQEQQQPASVAFIPILKHGGESPTSSRRGTLSRHDRNKDWSGPPRLMIESCVFGNLSHQSDDRVQEARARMRRMFSCSRRSRGMP